MRRPSEQPPRRLPRPVTSCGNADDRNRGHGGMLVQRLLDLSRIDVVPAADDQVLLAVDDVVVAVGVDAAISPVENQPSLIASVVASGRFQYPFITFGPLI